MQHHLLISPRRLLLIFEVRKKVSLMLSKLWLLKEKKRREEDRMRARDRGARKGTVKQTQKPLALVVKAKWLSNVNTTGT